MFEKAAEDATLDLYGSADDVYGKEDYKQGFKDGAEFGYNKANEWHCVKDGLSKAEKELIVNTPINRMNCFDMSGFADLYIGIEFGSVKEQWLQIVKMLEALRKRCLETKDEELFIEFVRMLPSSYKVVKL